MTLVKADMSTHRGRLDRGNVCVLLFAAFELPRSKTLPANQQQHGASCRAAGMTCLGEAGGGSWNVPSRPRVDMHPMQMKIKWEITDGRATSG